MNDSPQLCMAHPMTHYVKRSVSSKLLIAFSVLSVPLWPLCLNKPREQPRIAPSRAIETLRLTQRAQRHRGHRAILDIASTTETKAAADQLKAAADQFEKQGGSVLPMTARCRVDACCRRLFWLRLHLRRRIR